MTQNCWKDLQSEMDAEARLENCVGSVSLASEVVATQNRWLASVVVVIQNCLKDQRSEMDEFQIHDRLVLYHEELVVEPVAQSVEVPHKRVTFDQLSDRPESMSALKRPGALPMRLLCAIMPSQRLSSVLCLNLSSMAVCPLTLPSLPWLPGAQEK